MTPEELLAAARAERKVIAVTHELKRWYLITAILHAPPCYDPYCSCFVARELVTHDKEPFNYQDLSSYDIPKVQVGTVFLWVEALEETAGGSRLRVTHILFDGTVPEAPLPSPLTPTSTWPNTATELCSYVSNQIAAFLRSREGTKP